MTQFLRGHSFCSGKGLGGSFPVRVKVREGAEVCKDDLSIVWIGLKWPIAGKQRWDSPEQSRRPILDDSMLAAMEMHRTKTRREG